MVDNYTVEIQSPSDELNVHQYFNLFNSFLRSVGFDEELIMRGAVQLAFNDMRRVELMRKVADENDLILDEDLGERIVDAVAPVEERAVKAEQRVKDLSDVVLDLKAQLSRALNPDNPNYTDEELDAMTNEIIEDSYAVDISNRNMWEQGLYSVRTSDPYRSWKGDIPGTSEARDKGCVCPILDNQDMPDNRRWIDVNCPLHGGGSK